MSRILRAIGAAALAAFLLGQAPPELPLLVSDDFEAGSAAAWTPGDPARWRVGEAGGNHFYELTAPGAAGPIRAPTSWSVLTKPEVSEFVLTGRLRCETDAANIRRDMCVLFGFQDSTHFYYVHFSASSDAVHNVIALVNGSDRVKVNLEPEGKSIFRLTDKGWHDFKVVREAGGRIAAYLDDMATPILTARDTTLGRGKVGVGSFDDTGAFDDIRLRGR